MKVFNKLIIACVLCFSAVFASAQLAQKDFSKIISALDTLLTDDSDSLIKNRKKENLLHLAVWVEDMETIQWLVDKAPILLKGRDKDGDTPFLLSCLRGNMEIAHFFLSYEEFVDINETNKKKTSCLHYLASHLHLKGITSMVQKGADPALKDQDGDTPAHILLIRLQQIADYSRTPEDIGAVLDSLRNTI